MKKSFVILALTFIGAQTIKAQTLLNQNLIHDGNNREYALYIPASYDGSQEVPLLVNFHGGGGNIAEHIASADMRPIADTANFILVYPQAVPDPGNGGATSWMHKAPTTFDDVPFVEAMIDVIAAEYMIDNDRIYVCGYSLGGEFAYELACSLNNRIAATGAVARTMQGETFNNCAPQHPTGVITILGTADFISDYNGITFGGIQYYMSAAETHEYWVTANNCNANPTMSTVPNINTSDGSTVERYTWKDAAGCTYVEHLKVIDGGHDWPGVFGNMDIDASQEIWNFVSGYDLSGLIECATNSIENTAALEDEVRVFPNPFEDQLIVESYFQGAQNYALYSILGEHILSGWIQSGNTNINLETIPDGLYILKVRDQSLKVLKRK
jgi:polyhydroxybutyrate depolymerase